MKVHTIICTYIHTHTHMQAVNKAFQEGEDRTGVVFFALSITEKKALEVANTACSAAEAAANAKTEQIGFLCHEVCVCTCVYV
jgi:hypothetical protein